jgi:hypothetical protein
MNTTKSKPLNAAVIRGLVVVLAAVVIGVLLLRSSPETSDVSSAGRVPQPGDTTPLSTATTASTATGADTGEVTVSGTTPTTDTAGDTVAPSTSSDPVTTIEGFEPRAASEVSVQVANSTSVKGAAGRVNDDMKTWAYITRTPANLRGTAEQRTKVYYLPGSLLEAQTIAELLKLDSQNDVFRMFTDTQALDPYEEADVLVVVGLDLAPEG